MLGEHRECFHWVQIKEKFSVLRMHFELEDAPEPLWGTLCELVSQAQRESARCCMVCGEPASLSRKSAWVVTVCPLRELMQVPAGKRQAS